MESLEMLYTMSAKKEVAVLNAPGLTGNPLSVTTSAVSIAILLNLSREK